MSHNYTYPNVPLEYVNAAATAQEKQLNMRFLNDSHDYAKLLADLMIGRATTRHDVAIFTRGLDRSCYVDALKDTQANKVRVVAQDASVVQSNLALLPAEARNRIEVRIQPEIQTAESEAHFFVAGKSYRYELDHTKATAVANFNDALSTQNLMGKFNALWKSSAPLNER